MVLHNLTELFVKPVLGIVIPTGALASQREASAEWRACPELAEGDLLLPLGSFWVDQGFKPCIDRPE